MSAGSADAAPPRPRRPGTWYKSRFFWTVFAGLGAVYGYLGLRFIGPSELHGWPRALAWAGVVALLALVPASFAIRWSRGQLGTWTRTLQRAQYVILGLGSVTLALTAGRDALWAILHLVDAFGAALLPAAAARRSLLQDSNLAVGLLSLGLCAWGYWQAVKTPRLARLDVPIDGLPTALDGLKVLQLSDIHLGPNIGRAFVERVVARSRQVEADLVAITGDLVDGPVSELWPAAQPLAELRAPLGVYFITGNHEYYAGVDAWIEALPALGIEVLLNEHRVVEHRGERVVVAGVTDLHGRHFGAAHRSDPRRALAEAPAAGLRLLLAHQPLAAQAVAEANLDVDLQLSGHTHGGQIALWAPLVKLAQPFVAGLHRMGRFWVYTSRGTGFWGPPMRIGAPSEITVLTLRRPPAPAESC